MKLIMISAMYENGGNVTHRHLDGHPSFLVYPFESQLGTRFVQDEMSSMFPFKYRWPEFPIEATPQQDFESFFDEELKTRLRRPDGSKFRDASLDMEEDQRRQRFVSLMQGRVRTRAVLVSSFFQATFDVWRNLKKTGRETHVVGYSPVIGVDAEKILSDFPDAVILHVVRHPCAAYAETRYRPFPLSLERYTWTWVFVQQKVMVAKELFPRRVIIIRYEDLLQKKERVMQEICQHCGVPFHESLLYPSWNGERLDDVYPWGTIHVPDEQEQGERLRELSDEQKNKIRIISQATARALGYDFD